MAEKFLQRTIIGALLENDVVKFSGMIHLHGVGQFVNDDGFGNRQRQHNQPPIKVEIFLAGTTAPARFLAADGDAIVGEQHFFG